MRTLPLLIALTLAGCATTPRCVAPDLGGWIVGEFGSPYGIHHSCAADTERFVLQKVARTSPDGTRVEEWASLATFDVRLGRGESTMFGFACGSREGTRGDAIAVVRYHRDGSFTVKRAWTIDPENRKFLAVPPQTVVCEDILGEL